MTVNQLAEAPLTTSLPRARRLLTLSGAVGIGYSLSWIAGLSVKAPSPAFGAPGRDIVTAFAGHQVALATQLALTEGLPAAGIAVVSLALARAAREHGAIFAGRIVRLSGLVAATISALQFVVGMGLVATHAPATAHLLFGAVNRMDGVKMLTLAVLGLAAARAGVLPRWLRYAGVALGVTITVSGLVYLLLLQSLMVAAGPALALLLVFITGAGLTLGTRNTGTRKSTGR
jgi:hypothetical protein